MSRVDSLLVEAEAFGASLLNFKLGSVEVAACYIIDAANHNVSILYILEQNIETHGLYGSYSWRLRLSTSYGRLRLWCSLLLGGLGFLGGMLRLLRWT